MVSVGFGVRLVSFRCHVSVSAFASLLTRQSSVLTRGLLQWAKEIGVPAQRIGEIVAGRRAITAGTDLRLCRFFGLSNGYWQRTAAPRHGARKGADV